MGLCLSSKQHPVKRNQLNMSVGPYIEDMLRPLKGELGFAQVTIKEKQNAIFVQYSNFMRMRNN